MPYAPHTEHHSLRRFYVPRTTPAQCLWLFEKRPAHLLPTRSLVQCALSAGLRPLVTSWLVQSIQFKRLDDRLRPRDDIIMLLLLELRLHILCHIPCCRCSAFDCLVRCEKSAPRQRRECVAMYYCIVICKDVHEWKGHVRPVGQTPRATDARKSIRGIAGPAAG